MEWISVSDKMPDPEERVLVFNSHYQEITIGYPPIGSDSFWELVEPVEHYSRPPNYISSFITHWMPLPKAPNIVNDLNSRREHG